MTDLLELIVNVPAILRGLIGATLGALIFVYGPEYLATKSKGQSTNQGPSNNTLIQGGENNSANQANSGNTVNQTGTNNISQIGNNNHATIHAGPKRRIIDETTASKIISQLRSGRPYKFTLIDFTGGQDKDAYELKQRLQDILIAGRWIMDGFDRKSFLPIGGPALTGMRFAVKSRQIPEALKVLHNVLTMNGIPISNEVDPSGMVDSEDAVGIEIGRAE